MQVKLSTDDIGLATALLCFGGIHLADPPATAQPLDPTMEALGRRPRCTWHLIADDGEEMEKLILDHATTEGGLQVSARDYENIRTGAIKASMIAAQRRLSKTERKEK